MESDDEGLAQDPKHAVLIRPSAKSDRAMLIVPTTLRFARTRPCIDLDDSDEIEKVV